MAKHYCMANRRGKSGRSDRLPLSGFQSHCGRWLRPWNQKTTASWQESDDRPRQCVESRDITLLTKVRIVRAMVFPVVMYGCESWAIKKAEHQRIDVFGLWCWRRLLRIPWTARRSHQSMLRDINPENSLEWLMLKLKLQYFGYLIQTDSSDAGKDWGQEKRASEDEMAGWHHWCTEHELGQTLGDGEGQGGLVCCSPQGWKELGFAISQHDWATKQQQWRTVYLKTEYQS